MTTQPLASAFAQRLEAEAGPKLARVVRPAAGACEPLYAATRVLSGEALALERGLEQAREELRATREACVQMREQAERECAAVLEAAREQVEGEKRRAVQSARQAASRKWRATLQALEREIEQQREQFEADVLEASYRFARAILDVEFAVRPERIVELVATAVERARLHGRIELHLHPDEAPLVKAAIDRLRAERGLRGEITVHQDRKLSLRGVRIETEMGAYDASIDEQFRPLREHLARAARQRGASS